MKDGQRTRRVAALSALVVFLCVSCGCTSRVRVPQLAPGGSASHLGKFVWHELITNDPRAAERFYGGLFGWTFERLPGGDGIYTVVASNGKPIGGIVDGRMLERPPTASYWLGSISIADVERGAEAVRSGGGRVFEGPKKKRRQGRFAVVGDPQGAVFALLRSSAGDPADGEPALNAWFWDELATQDPDASAAFYRALLGYEIERFGGTGVGSYLALRRDGVVRAGVIENPFDQVGSRWIPYIRVADPADIVARVASLGGSILVPPSSELRNGSIAFIQDPSNVPVGIQRWPTRSEPSR